MSIFAMKPVWDADLKPAYKFVLLAYADSAKRDGTESWPGWGSLQKMTGYSRSQIGRITKDLIEIGILVQTKRGRKGQRAEYTIVLDHPLVEGAQDASLSSGSKAEDVRVQSEADRVQSEADRVHGDGPLPSSTPVLFSHPKAPTYRTLMKNALVAAMGWNTAEITKRQWDRVEVAAKELCSINADPDDVDFRARVYRVNMAGATMTPNAIAVNWADLATPREPLPARQVKRAAANAKTKAAIAALKESE